MCTHTNGFTFGTFRSAAAVTIVGASLLALAACSSDSGDASADKSHDKAARAAGATTPPAATDGSPLSGVAHAATAVRLAYAHVRRAGSLLPAASVG